MVTSESGREAVEAGVERPSASAVRVDVDQIDDDAEADWGRVPYRVAEERAEHPRRYVVAESELHEHEPDDASDGPVDRWSDRRESLHRVGELETEGHGPQRHVERTDDVLGARLGTAEHDSEGNVAYRANGHVKKERGSQIDPATGTNIDADDGKLHYCGPYATTFNDAADYCRSDEVLRERARSQSDPIQRAAISDIFPDRDPNDLFTGFYQDPENPENEDGSPRLKRIDFTGGTLYARYDLKEDGQLRLVTMFSDPDHARNPGKEVRDGR